MLIFPLLSAKSHHTLQNLCSVPSIDMHEHRSRCPLEVINCEYETMGCEVRMTRQTQQEHNKEKMEYHLHLTKCKLDEINRELSIKDKCRIKCSSEGAG